MRTRAEREGFNNSSKWVGGARSFFYKGTNGRWRDVLTEDELDEYENKASEVLTLDAKAWLERAGPTIPHQ